MNDNFECGGGSATQRLAVQLGFASDSKTLRCLRVTFSAREQVPTATARPPQPSSSTAAHGGKVVARLAAPPGTSTKAPFSVEGTAIASYCPSAEALLPQLSSSASAACVLEVNKAIQLHEAASTTTPAVPTSTAGPGTAGTVVPPEKCLVVVPSTAADDRACLVICQARLEEL